MITKVTINNFKKLELVSFNLAQSVVVIGPNNSGKSTIFQALCMWEIGVTSFIQSYQKGDLNSRGAATINRKDLLNSPIADARFLWRNRKVTYKNEQGHTKHIKLEVELQGEDNGAAWVCKAEFEFSNTESFSCRVTSGLKEIIELYNSDKGIHFGFLQPMSGMSTNEDKLTQGSIERKLGEGKTAEVLRNICFEILYPDTPHPKGYDPEEKWEKLRKGVKSMFGADLLKPEFIKATGIIQLEYTDDGIRYDISSAGRGFQQTLLLLAYMYANPNTILLLDEPDAHLEVIRQREAFQLINDIANDMNSQLIVASHSEVVLEEAAEASKVVAIIENQIFELNEASSAQKLRSIKKALTEIGWEKYYLAKSRK
ncbi:MAG: ATP-binding protein, partial [Flammeovirgaceae bacterium]|nr:ATP-binding protein [Flammeovirgaceae bacterium]